MSEFSFHLGDVLDQQNKINLNEEFNRLALSLSPGICQLDMCSYNLQMGIRFTQFRANFTQHKQELLKLGIVNFHSPTPYIIIITTKSGKLFLQDKKRKIEHATTRQKDLFSQIKNFETTLILDCQSDIQVSIFLIPHSIFSQIFGKRLTYEFIQSSGLRNYTLQTLYVPSFISHEIHKSLSTPDIDLKKLLLQTNLFNYLGQLVLYLLAPATHVSKTLTKANILKICDELFEPNGRLPTLEQTSKKYGLSSNALDNAFKKEFGKSYHNFFFSQRMQKAQETIRLTATPLKTISQQLGYSHVNHFSHAFRKFFGYPPGSLRELD